MIKITSAQLTKDSTLNVGFIEEIIDPDTEIKSIKTHPQVKCSLIVHNDVKQMFADLAGHLGALCQLPEMDFLDPEERRQPEGITVNKILISGENELSLQLFGYRDIAIGRMNIENPSLKFDDGNYPHLEKLIERVSQLQEETILYLNGKTASKRQLNIFEDASDFSNHSDDLEMNEDGVKPKKKSRKLKLVGLENMEITVSSSPTL